MTKVICEEHNLEFHVSEKAGDATAVCCGRARPIEMKIPYTSPEEPTALGLKFDDGKPRLELLPPKAIEEVAKVLMFGASKYDEFNWAKGMNWSRLVGAIMRHVNQFNQGIDADSETGISHMAHAAVDCLFLLEYQLRGLGTDNRHKWDKQ